MKKVAVVFINENGYCITEDKVAEEIDAEKVKVYAAITATRININRTKGPLTVSEAEDMFRESLSTDEVCVVVREFENETIAFGTKMYLLEEYFERYRIARMGSLDIVLYDAYRDQVGSNPAIVGVVDPWHGFLAYEIITENGILETTIRKKVISETVIVKNRKKVVTYAEETIKAAARQESERYGKGVDYIIAGINDDYKKLESVILSIGKTESFHRYFIDENIYLYKKVMLGLIGAGTLGLLYLTPENLYMSQKSANLKQQIKKTHSYIQEQKSHIRHLYEIKGKTIIMEDYIDIRKLAETLGYLYALPPDRAVYKTDKNFVNVTMLYNNVILAQLYYNEIKANKHIHVTLEVGKNFKTAKVVIKIPKRYLSGG